MSDETKKNDEAAVRECVQAMDKFYKYILASKDWTPRQAQRLKKKMTKTSNRLIILINGADLETETLYSKCDGPQVNPTGIPEIW